MSVKPTRHYHPLIDGQTLDGALMESIATLHKTSFVIHEEDSPRHGGHKKFLSL